MIDVPMFYADGTEVPQCGQNQLRHMSTRGAKKGNQNSAKDRRKSSQVVFRCFEEDRAEWEACAKAENLSLAAWICRSLNQNKGETEHSKSV